MNQALLENFVAPVYSKTPRNQEAYRATYRYCCSRLESVLEIYRNSTNDQQTLRLVRDDMDNLLRRYHEYCIKQRNGMGAHYHEIGADVETDFEHLIPAARVRDLMISGLLTIDQALNCPTVKLSREKHHLLKESGWGSHTPNIWNPWQRYTDIFDAKFKTHDGQLVDTATWTLDKHYQQYGYLVEEYSKQ